MQRERRVIRILSLLMVISVMLMGLVGCGSPDSEGVKRIKIPGLTVTIKPKPQIHIEQNEPEELPDLGGKSTIEFINHSGQTALVKVLGPTRLKIEVPDGESRTVNVSGGWYFIKTRYGDAPSHYTYTRGEKFEVKETAQTLWSYYITLHPVVDGNYETFPISPEEFN